MNHERSNHKARRSVQIRRVIEDCLRRRAAGEALTNEQVLAEHADLLPELQEELDLLSVMESAAERARGSSCAARLSSADDLSSTTSPSRDALPGYEIVGEVRRGGQGVVYEAVQTTTRRKVAIKVLNRQPFSGRHGDARFEREVRILARLNHPNIVTVHDTGRISDSDFFVMDYIEGEPLDRWVANAAAVPTTTEILVLFAKVCNAVNAAHLRGVIHRDLKPSNVRVDRDGQPHVLDFGLAKLSNDEIGRLADDSDIRTATLPGQFVGSLPWASPEQAEGSANIDLRTDVYSLGVMLYQMLTGAFPYDVEGALHDVLGRIMHAEPIRPGALNARVRGEVETIILKCLAKDRQRRYQSAGELARDIERYLAGEPIEAKGDSFSYVLAKQLRRHRWAVAVACSFVLVLVGGFATSFVYWRKAASDRDAAEAARTAANEARQAEEQQRERAETAAETAKNEAARADAVKAFLQMMLVAADPAQPRARDVTVRDVLDDAARRLQSGALANQPDVEIEIRETIARTYNHLGLYNAATPHYEWLHDSCVRRLDESDRKSVRALIALARNYAQAEDYQAAKTTFERSLELAVAEHGEDQELTLAAMDGLGSVLAQMGRAEEAESLHLEALEGVEQALGQEHELFVSTTFNLGMAYETQGRLEDAERLYLRALEVAERLHGEDSYSAIRIRRRLAYDIYRRTGRTEEAEELLRDTLELARRKLGAEHTETNIVLIGLSRVLTASDRIDEAEQLLRDAIAGFGDIQAIENNDTLKVVGELANALVARGDPKEAARVLRDGIDRAIATHGDEHAFLADWIYEYANIVTGAGDFSAGAEAGKHALDIRRRVLGPGNSDVALSMQQIGWCCDCAGDYQEAADWYRQTLALRREISGETNRETIRSSITLAFAMLLAGEGRAAAADVLRERFELVRSELGDTHAQTQWVARYLATVLSYAGHHDEAIALDREMLDTMSVQYGEDALETAAWRHWLGLQLYNSGRPVEAIEPYKRALSIYRAYEKEETEGALQTKRELAETLIAAGEPEEAEALACDALKVARDATGDRSVNIPWTMIILAEALVDVGKPAEAETLLRDALALLDVSSTRAIYRSAFGGQARSVLGQCLAVQGRYEEAEPLLLEGHHMLRDVEAVRRTQARNARSRLIALYTAWGKPAKARNWE